MNTDTERPLTEQADQMDSLGHHWSGQPAHDFFEAATAIRAVDVTLNGRHAEEPVSTESLQALMKRFDYNGHLWSGPAAQDFWAAWEALRNAYDLLAKRSDGASERRNQAPGNGQPGQDLGPVLPAEHLLAEQLRNYGIAGLSSFDIAHLVHRIANGERFDGSDLD
ncbi:hypothetical protein [Curtobacterium sp. MCBD17_040]|uniref:hypothetical protein n=1 Tax=Curtobacterium sp. MCBD17_040 TaxID=2175674 RepID=UPI000DA80541|nr:hypothetical protein [Curtobacterium sp. MCBD17_040]WIB65916.1 hypothetical protein DEI94_17525 [Curtobacterium sp. MCBD17_040]